MAYKVIILYRLYMPSYFLGTFTEYPKIMQNLLEKHGFIRCGIIYVANGTPRIAYQRHNTSHS